MSGSAQKTRKAFVEEQMKTGLQVDGYPVQLTLTATSGARLANKLAAGEEKRRERH